MGISNFHADPFHESTATKLALYQEYVEAWLPTFMTHPAKVKAINVFDLFCGPGCDCDGNDGSPILLLKSLKKFLYKKETASPPPINIYFNDSARKKINHLEEMLLEFNFPKNKVSIHVTCSQFENRFDECRAIMTGEGAANLIFIDQCGINALTKERFKFLTECPRTDWLCFMASSIVRRMPEHENIQKYVQLKQGGRWADTHRTVTDYYRASLENKDYFLVPFSLRRGSTNNIYGLIFGTGHSAGAEKFLRACWKLDKQHGEANFPIEDPKAGLVGQMSLLEPRKIQCFKSEFEMLILDGTIRTNEDAFNYTLHAGMLPDHAREVVGDLRKRKKLAQPVNISYDTVVKKKKITPIVLNK